MPDTTAAKPTLLAVDDKPANLVALEALLGDEYRLLFASSGREAISLLRKQPSADVILLDVQMPGMDGFETAAAIKQLDGAADIPIVFVTAVYNEDPHIRQGYAAGGIDYFGKPFDPDILKLKLRIYASFRTRELILRKREAHLRESEELLSFAHPQVGRGRGKRLVRRDPRLVGWRRPDDQAQERTAGARARGQHLA